MKRDGPPDSSVAWCVVLPDAGGLAISSLLADEAEVLAEHGSGRPWIFGYWPQWQVWLREAGSARLALLGCVPQDPPVLLPQVAHLAVDHDTFSGIYSRLSDALAPQDGSFRWARSLGRYRHTSELIAAQGSAVHLAGHGGDELFGHFAAQLVDLAGRSPLRRHARHAPRQNPLPASSTPARLTNGIGTPLPGAWGLTVRMPPWATSAVCAVVRDRMHAEADTVPILSGATPVRPAHPRPHPGRNEPWTRRTRA